MKETMKSLGFARAGLWHALQTERNLKRFAVAYLLILLLGIVCGLSPSEWVAVIISCGMFFSIELLNTALERLVDTFDDYQKQLVGSNEHVGLKLTKDVASAAALAGLLTVIVVLCIVFPPHLKVLFGL